MCRTKTSTDIITPKSRSSRRRSSARSNTPPAHPSSCSLNHSTNDINNTTADSKSYNFSKSSFSSQGSLSSLKDSLPEKPHIYEFSEIAFATRNFTAEKFSSSSLSSSWRCLIRNKDVVVFQRRLPRPLELPELRDRLALVCRSHHSSLIKLLGASISGHYIYLVYDYVNGVNLANCLRNKRNPNFTVLSNWLSRIQIASDLAYGLDYIHHCSGLNSIIIHNHIKSSSVIIAEDTLNAKICHFGTSDLCGEIDNSLSSLGAKDMRRSGSGKVKLQGTRGYMAPEFPFTGMATEKTDVYAFGVVLLELVSGEEPLKFTFDEGDSGGYKRISVIETAREAVEEEGGGGGVRKWVDKRLKDSYPVDVVDRLIRVGLECVEEDPEKRPDMVRVAGLISKMFLDSQKWADKFGPPQDFSISIAPRPSKRDT